MNRKRVNHEVHIALKELTGRPDLNWFYLQDGIDAQESWVVIMAAAVTGMAFIFGLGVGWLIAYWKLPDELSLPAVMVGGGLCGSFAGIKIYMALIDAARSAYEAEMEKVNLPSGRSFVSAANNQNKAVSLNERDKLLLQTFAVHYPRIRSLGINEWEGDNSPFTFAWLSSKRAGIKRVQDLVMALELGTRDGRGAITLNAAGEARVEEWRNGKFDPEPALPQNSRPSRIQEVAHE